MSSKNAPQSKVIAKKNPSPGRLSNGVVDAVLFNTPDLSFFLKLQNLLNYFVDCMNNLASSPEKHTVFTEHLKRCIQFIGDIDSTSTAIDDNLRRILNEFIGDARQFENLLESISNPREAGTTDRTAAMLLTAKASRLQWLSVCILEDIKNSYSRT
jgi:hypothetical protein